MRLFNSVSGTFMLAGILMIVATANWAVQFIEPESDKHISEYKKIREMVKSTFPGRELRKVNATPVAGLYEILVPPNIFYTTLDGEFILQGNLYKVKEKKNLTKLSMLEMEKELSEFRIKEISKVNEESMIIFPVSKPEYTISVFTDVDCVFCQKLHKDIKKYNDMGITVRYLSFPRQPEGSDTYNKSVSVWCADNRKDALTKAKKGLAIESRQCKNPVADLLALGHKLGINSTPSIILPNGRILAGYHTAPELLSIIKKQNSQNLAKKK